MAKLNPKHHAVAHAYIKDPERIGWRAYKAVFPKSSRPAAQTAWSRLFKKAEFAALIAALTQKAADAAVMDLNEVLAELSKIGRSSIKNYVAGGDTTRDVIEALQSLPDEHAAAIQELTVETYIEGGGEDARPVKRVKLKLHSKPQALAELRSHFEPHKHEHTGKDGGAIETKDVSEMSDLETARRIAFALQRALLKKDVGT